MRSAYRRSWRTIAAVVIVLSNVSVFAHTVAVEQVVEMTVRPQGDVLSVELHVPAAVTGDPSLPRLLNSSDRTQRDRHLDVVAADVVRNLDIKQGATTLAPSSLTAMRGGATIVVVQVRYPLRSGSRDFSARLNAFNGQDGPVRTTARYLPESGREQIVSIAGPATRVAFDPPIAGVVSAFALRAFQLLFDANDQLLFIICALLPVRRLKSLLAIFAAAAIGQTAAIAMAMAGVAPPGLGSSAAALIAASALVVAAMQNIARARLRWVLPVALVFGTLNGWTVGNAGTASLQLAGAHRPIAMLAFGCVWLIGGLWGGAVAWALRVWLAERGLHERLTVVVGSALIAHTAVHHALDRAQAGSSGSER